MQEHPVKIARMWLQQAQSDLVGARGMIDIEHHDLACFLSQQVAEKALKGLLIWLSGDKPRTHIIAELVREARKLHAFDDDAFVDVEALDQYYVATRYPDALGGALPALTFRRKQSAEAVSVAEQTIALVEKIVPEYLDEEQ